MKRFSFSRLFSRKQKPEPATARIYLLNDEQPAWRHAPEKWPSERPLDAYKPKPALAADPLKEFLLSLPLETRLRAMRILRQDYAAPLRMAA